MQLVSSHHQKSKESREEIFIPASKSFARTQGPTIPLTTIYNTLGQLVEVSIINCELIIPQMFIKLIGVAVPFHRNLNKLTIRKGGLSQVNIYEIYKMLPYSNITDVCLDDNYVRQANYYVLLEALTSLKILSLCRCSIDETVCEKIVRRLEPGRPGDKLQSLSLSTNFIGNVGALKFGNLLRRNRNLLHLNLADNGIGHTGAAAILESLKEFMLNEDDIRKNIKKKMAFEKENKRAVTNTIAATSSSILKCQQPTKDPSCVLKVAYKKSGTMVGGSEIFFDNKNTVRKNNKLYCIGNIRLCYLNLAYNNLDNRILKQIREVLEYQDTLAKHSNNTGLIKVQIEGNCFSTDDVNFLVIQGLFTKILSVFNPSTSGKLRLSSHNKTTQK